MFAWFIHEHRHVECNASIGVCQPQGLLGFFEFKVPLVGVFIVTNKGTVDNHAAVLRKLVEVSKDQRIVTKPNLAIASTLLVISALDGTKEPDHAIATTELVAVCQ